MRSFIGLWEKDLNTTIAKRGIMVSVKIRDPQRTANKYNNELSIVIKYR